MWVEVFEKVGCYDFLFIVGEEFELCVCYCDVGYCIDCIDYEMILYDVVMIEVGQWWKCLVCVGYVYVEGVVIYGEVLLWYWVCENQCIWFWGVVLLGVVIGVVLFMFGVSLVLFVGYLIMVVKVYKFKCLIGCNCVDVVVYLVLVVVG